MASVRLRPRFRLVVPCEPEQALSSFRLRLQQPDCPYTGTVMDRHISLRVVASEAHYWSPVLNVDAEPDPGGTLLRGHFGPHPNVWTLLLALSAGICFSMVFASMYGLSQWLVQVPPTALWALLPGFGLLAVIYAVSLLGQGLAQAQMHQLRDFFACAVCHPQLEEIRASLLAQASEDEAGLAACRACHARQSACAN